MSQKVKEGTKVSVHYIGKLDNGSEFDNSYTRNTPLDFEVGKKQMIPGFESAVINREVGEKFKVKIPTDQAYGVYTESKIQEVPKEQLNLPDDVEMGIQIQGTTPEGQQFLCVLKEVKDNVAYLDLNHPLAGQDLNFDIEILSVSE
jgi:peptidylprolyl isomerase